MTRYDDNEYPGPRTTPERLRELVDRKDYTVTEIGFCRVCSKPLGDIETRGGTTICEECEIAANTPHEPRGLYPKYLVFKNDGKLIQKSIEDCFVLRPKVDVAARNALTVYAWMTPNTQLRDDLFAWLDTIAQENESSAPETSENSVNAPEPARNPLWDRERPNRVGGIDAKPEEG